MESAKEMVEFFLPFISRISTWKLPSSSASTIILTLIIVILVNLAYFALTHWSRISRLVNKFPGPTPLPFIGNLNTFMGPTTGWQTNLSSLILRHGRCFPLWFSYRPIMLIADGKVAEKVLTGSENIEKSDIYKLFHRFVGNGMMTSPGIKWKHDRRILNPAFTYKYFDGFLKTFNEQSRTLGGILEDTFQTGDEKVNLLPYLTRCTMESVYHTVLGTKRDLQMDPDEKLSEQIAGLLHCMREKMLRIWLNLPIIWHTFGMGRLEDKLFDECMEQIVPTVEKRIEDKKVTDEIPGMYTKPLIDFLIDANTKKEDIVLETNLLLVAGSGTSSTSAYYTLFLLALNPDCLQKVHEELDAVFASDKKRDLTLADLSELKYLEMCAKEGLRLYPPVGFWSRKLSTDVNLDDGRILPKGVEVAILPWDIHRNPKVFPDPELFDPERFHFNNRHLIGPADWLPFSYGPRNCIGHRYAMMQIMTLLIHILRDFSVFTNSRREDLRVLHGIVLETVPEIKVTLRRRE